MVTKCIGVLYFLLMICSLCFHQGSQPGNQIPFINSANPVMSLVGYCTLYSNLIPKCLKAFTVVTVIIFTIHLYGCP
jgi:hypothetical protein